MNGAHEGREPDRPPRLARALVAATLAVLVVAGVAGIEAWPLTAWRLFSLARDEDQSRWVLEAVDADGSERIVSLEELPLRYRQAEWPMADLPEASRARADAVCLALADAVVRLEPGTVELRIVRDRQEMVEVRDGFEVAHDPEVVHSCRPEVAP